MLLFKSVLHNKKCTGPLRVSSIEQSEHRENTSDKRLFLGLKVVFDMRHAATCVVQVRHVVFCRSICCFFTSVFFCAVPLSPPKFHVLSSHFVDLAVKVIAIQVLHLNTGTDSETVKQWNSLQRKVFIHVCMCLCLFITHLKSGHSVYKGKVFLQCVFWCVFKVINSQTFPTQFLKCNI